MKTSSARAATLAGILALVAVNAAPAGDSWPRRFGNSQNTADAGDDPLLSPATAQDLSAVAHWAIGGNATPIVGFGLLFYASKGIYVIDLASKKTLIHMTTAGGPLGVETTGTLAVVTAGDGNGGTREENRYYIGAGNLSDTLYCLNVDAIVANQAALNAAASPYDGPAYICDGPAATRPLSTSSAPPLFTTLAHPDDSLTPRKPWPLSLEPPTPGVGPGLGVVGSYDGAPIFSRDQPIAVNGKTEIRDILFAPSMGYEPSCSNGVVWAIDAYTGEKLWQWDPVENGNGTGGLVWFAPAMSKDKKHLYVTTGDCVDKPQAGERAEAIIALDPETGAEQWFRQARLIDSRDYDIGNSPNVVDVDGADGCHVVVNVDKDGCFYGYNQEADKPQVGEPGYDSTRPGQQRLLWRTCVAQSGATGGFDANGANVHGRWVMAQSQLPGGKDAGDNAYGFVVDACTGEFQKATSDLASGYGEGAVASGMWFIANKTNTLMQVIRAEPPFDLLATVALPAPAAGGGGPAIANGTVYVPAGGIVAVRVDPTNPGSSAPKPGPALAYHGPYAEPLGTRDVNLGPPWPAGDVIAPGPDVPYPGGLDRLRP